MKYNSFTYLGVIKKILGKYTPNKHDKSFVLNNLLSTLNYLPKGNYLSFAKMCINNNKISHALNLNIKTNYCIDPTSEIAFPFLFIFDTFGFFLNKNKDFFNDFQARKNTLEEYVILGEYSNCIITLDFIDKEYGKSIWAIDARMSVYSKFNKVDELNEFKKIFEGSSEYHMATLLYSKYTSRTLNLFYKQVLANLLKEYRSNDRGSYADLISLFLVPCEIDSGFDFSKLILLSQRLNPIDRLLIYKKIAFESVVEPLLCQESWYEPMLSFIKNINYFMVDSSWKHIVDFKNSSFNIRVDDSFNELIAVYSRGDYDRAISLCEKFLLENPRELSVLDIYSRSLIYTENEDIILDKNKMPYNVHSVLLMSLATLHHDTDRYEITCEVIETHLFKYLNFDFIYAFKPLYLAAYPFIKSKRLLRSSKELYCSSFYVTPKYLSIVLNSNKEFFSNSFKEMNNDMLISDFTDSRKIRIQLESYLKNNEIEISDSETEHQLEKLSDINDILKSECQYLWVSCKLKQADILSVISRMSNYCIENISKNILFPLIEVVEILNEGHDLYSDNISSVLCYYFNFRVNDFDSKELTSEKFEDYLTSQDVTRPSQLAENWDFLDDERKFFLIQVCSPEMMSIIVDIDTKQTLLIERLKILQILVNKFEVFEVNLFNEMSHIYDELTIDRLAKNHANNKVAIDSNGIRKSRTSEYQSYFDQINYFNTFGEDVVLDLFVENEQEGVTKQDNAILHFYGSVYHHVIDDYVFNEDFGLIRYLNSEIRHGVMPNQIRSVLEAYFLVTFMEEDNKYESNIYWRKAYELTALEPFLDFIDQHLEWFSRSVDELIEIANDWIVPTKDTNNRNVAFNLSCDMNKLKEFKEFIKGAESTDDLMYLCEEFVWQQLDSCFRIMRSLLNKELKTKFNDLFEELTLRLNNNPHNIELNQLGEVIQIAQNKVTEEISIIEGWFCRPQKSRIGTTITTDVFKVSIGILKGIFDPRKLIFDNTLSEISFDLCEEQSLGLTRALITGYQNALIHGVSHDGKDILLTTIVEDNVLKVVITNYVTEKKLNEIVDKDIVFKVSEYEKSVGKDLLATIGGTGLYKMFRYVVDSFENSSFTVKLEHKRFSQIFEISFKH